MILEMKVPSPGESITEVEIAQWLVSDGDYVEKDQAIAEVDSDKATLELPAEISGTITLKAEEGDAVEVGAVVCLIDSEGNASASKIKDKTTDNIKAESPEIAVQTLVVESSYAAQSPSPAAKKIMNDDAGKQIRSHFNIGVRDNFVWTKVRDRHLQSDVSALRDFIDSSQ